MSTFSWSNKQAKINTLQSELKTITTDRDKLLETVKDLESKIDQSKQSTAAISLGSQGWETEKQSLIDTHTKAIAELTKTIDDKAKLTSEMEAKFQAEKEQLVKDHAAAVEKLQAEHKAAITVTDEKVSQSAAVKLNAMNLSEGDLPEPTEKNKTTITIEQAKATLKSLSGSDRQDFYRKHRELFKAQLPNKV